MDTKEAAVKDKDKFKNIKEYKKEIESFEKQFILPLETSFDSGCDLESIVDELDISKPEFSSAHDSDCDSGAFSECSSPRLTEQDLESPSIVLSVTNNISKQLIVERNVDSKQVLSCLSEAGKSSDISSQLTSRPVRSRNSETWRQSLESILETRKRRLPLLQTRRSNCHLDCFSEVTVNGEHICEFAKL